jgi:hypothetical protein
MKKKKNPTWLEFANELSELADAIQKNPELRKASIAQGPLQGLRKQIRSTRRAENSRCPECGAYVIQLWYGRPRIYCSDKCKLRAHRHP